MEDWIGASVWRVGRTSGDQLMYERSVKACSNVRKRTSEKEEEHLTNKRIFVENSRPRNSFYLVVANYQVQDQVATVVILRYTFLRNENVLSI